MKLIWIRITLISFLSTMEQSIYLGKKLACVLPWKDLLQMKFQNLQVNQS